MGKQCTTRPDTTEHVVLSWSALIGNKMYVSGLLHYYATPKEFSNAYTFVLACS